MKTDQNNYNQAIETLPNAYARHRIVTDESSNPVDYIFLQVNAAFEQMTGLKREKIIDRKVTEVLPGIEKAEFDWIGIYGKVAQGGGSLNFEQYSEPLKRLYDVQAYSDEAGFFTTVFNETTTRKDELASMRNLLQLSNKLFSSDQTTFDYQAAIDSLLKLSGAKFAAINTYEENRTKAVTRAVAGVSVANFAASYTLGFEITGRAWEIIPERLRKIEGGKLVCFSNLFETSMGAINETTAVMLQELFVIGDIYVLELAYGGQQTMGDIIFFMPKEKEIQNREAIELYAAQIGSLLSRLKTEEALSIANINMTTVLENSIFGVAIIDKKRTIRWVNPVVCKLAGAESPEELIGRQCGDYLCPAEQHECPILDKGQKLDNSERILRRNDGQTIPILKSVTEIILEGEEVLLETFIDNTERNQAEEALRESEENYRTLLENAPDTIARFDRSLRHVFINKKAVEELGLPVESFIGKTNRELGMPGSVIEKWEAGLRAAFHEKKEQVVDIEIETPKGFACYTSRIVPEFTHGDAVDTVLSITRNITDRKKIEEALKLQVRERAAVDTFTYSVSNDLQAPLRRIEGFSEMLLEECSDQLNERARDYLNRIVTQVSSMKALTDALLQLSKVVSRKIDREAVDLSALTRSNLEKLQYEEPDRQLELVIAPGLITEGDPELLTLMLAKLLDNAWKFSAFKKEARIEFGNTKQDERTVYYLKDNGVGFDMNHAEKLFAPFHKLHSENEYPGIGIGLNLVYRIISRHGGEIWAEGEVGKGACFYFTLSGL